MSKYVPFTIHIKVVPERPGKRFEYIRSLQKAAVLVYDQLVALSGFQFATPGGGQAQQFGDIEQRGGLGSYASATAIKPQIGHLESKTRYASF